MCKEANDARSAIREANDSARRYREAATRLHKQWEAAQQLPPTPANKRHTNQTRRLWERNNDLATQWATRGQELKS